MILVLVVLFIIVHLIVLVVCGAVRNRELTEQPVCCRREPRVEKEIGRKLWLQNVTLAEALPGLVRRDGNMAAMYGSGGNGGFRQKKHFLSYPERIGPTGLYYLVTVFTVSVGLFH